MAHTETAPRREFQDMGVVGPVNFMGGVIFLRGYGCKNCGDGFWTEDGTRRRLPVREHFPCPRCSELSKVVS